MMLEPSPTSRVKELFLLAIKLRDFLSQIDELETQKLYVHSKRRKIMLTMLKTILVCPILTFTLICFASIGAKDVPLIRDVLIKA